MKEITLTVICSCGFQVQRVFYTNEFGYFEIPGSYCPDCFCVLTWSTAELPADIIKQNIN